MSTLLEGVEAILLWCSLTVLAPTLLVVLIARSGRGWVVAGSIVGTATMMWARAGGLWDWPADGARRWALGVAVIVTLVAVHRARRPAAPLRIALGGVAGAMSGWLWQPCVGEELAEVLNQSETARAASLVGMHAYVIGLTIPAIVLAALPHAWPPAERALGARSTRWAGLGLSIAYGIAVAVGWYDDLVSELFRLSSS